MTSHLSIHLLGPLEVHCAGEPLAGFEYNKVRALLAYLAAEAGPHSRLSLCALLWPDLQESAARQNLSQALSHLRKVLGDKQAPTPHLLTTPESVQLNPAAVYELDVALFDDLITAAEAHPHRLWRLCSPCAGLLNQAVGLYRGDFLAHFYIADSIPFEEWASVQRERLRQRMLSALERLAQYAEWRGAFEQAAAYARQHTQLEPYDEGMQRELIRLLALSGQRTAALAQYASWQRQLAELGLETEAASAESTASLYAQVRTAASLDHRSLLPALRRFQPPVGFLPEPPAAFIGRTEDLEVVGSLFANGARLVTLTGAPGIGKTRLALETARRLRYDFEDGVFFIELAPSPDAERVPQALAQVLGVKEQPGRILADAIQSHLQNKHTLLVLDNFEHVIEAAGFVAGLLAACPALNLLVTSRTPLRIRAEQQYVLAPLAEREAVQLFTERAKSVRPGFALTEENFEIVAALCNQLDNLPLGIELVAVRLRTYTPVELRLQLSPPPQPGRAEAPPTHRLDALSAARDLPERQSSLRRAIAWSFDRLTADEQHVLTHLSVFAGGCTLAAAQAVVGKLEPLGSLETHLETLTENSLVITQPVAGETRFSLLETIREFAQEKLHEHQQAALQARARHARYFARLAMDAYTGLNGPEGARWLERIAAEQDNVRLGFRSALEQGEHKTALRLATGVWRFHWMRGLWREGLERLETALARRSSAPLELQSNALRAAGTLAIGLCDYPRARGWLEQAVETGRSLPDTSFVQAALTNLGFALLEQGEVEAAHPCLDESLALARRQDNPCNAKFPLSMLGSLHLRAGFFPQAQACYAESLRLNRACQDTEGAADALLGLGRVACAQGDIEAAMQLGAEALALHQSLDHHLGIGQGQALFGRLAHAQGNYAEALQHYRRCLTLWADRENIVQSAFVLDDIAHTLCQVGRQAGAVQLMAAATAIRARGQVKLTAHEQAVWEQVASACRQALGSEAYELAWAQGSRLTPEEAVAEALAERR